MIVFSSVLDHQQRLMLRITTRSVNEVIYELTMDVKNFFCTPQA